MWYVSHVLHVTCRLSPPTCPVSLTATATAMHPPAANSHTVYSRLIGKDPKNNAFKKSEKIIEVPQNKFCLLVSQFLSTKNLQKTSAWEFFWHNIFFVKELKVDFDEAEEGNTPGQDGKIKGPGTNRIMSHKGQKKEEKKQKQKTGSEHAVFWCVSGTIPVRPPYLLGPLKLVCLHFGADSAHRATIRTAHLSGQT